jgi:hypothetical protein
MRRYSEAVKADVRRRMRPLTWTPETELVLLRASQAARLGKEKPHETQAPHTRADHPQAAHREQLLNQGRCVADVCRALEVSTPTYRRWQ